MSNTTPVSARARIDAILDDNSFVEIGAGVKARATDFNITKNAAPSDGVITGYGVINGNLVYVYSQDAAVMNGTVGEMHAKKIEGIYDMALKMGAPVIGLIDCAGIRLQEATDALDAFGKIYRKMSDASGVIPQITAVYGNCGGGLAVLAGLSDFTFMEEKTGHLFVNSPNALAGNYAEKLDTSSAKFQAEAGVVDFTGDEETIANGIRQLVSILPANNETEAFADREDDLNRVCADMASEIADPALALSDISDDNLFVEVKAEFAKEMVTGFIQVDGSTIGAVANRSEKSIAKAVAKLTYAFANANVPKVNVITGEAYGSAYVTMNSKALGADVTYAWPDASIGMMDANEAAKIMYADDIAKSADVQSVISEKAAEYAALQSGVESAAARGYVDTIINPEDTRKYVTAAFEMLYTKREDRPDKKHGTV